MWGSFEYWEEKLCWWVIYFEFLRVEWWWWIMCIAHFYAMEWNIELEMNLENDFLLKFDELFHFYIFFNKNCIFLFNSASCERGTITNKIERLYESIVIKENTSVIRFYLQELKNINISLHQNNSSNETNIPIGKRFIDLLDSVPCVVLSVKLNYNISNNFYRIEVWCRNSKRNKLICKKFHLWTWQRFKIFRTSFSIQGLEWIHSIFQRWVTQLILVEFISLTNGRLRLIIKMINYYYYLSLQTNAIPPFLLKIVRCIWRSISIT